MAGVGTVFRLDRLETYAILLSDDACLSPPPLPPRTDSHRRAHERNAPPPSLLIFSFSLPPPLPPSPRNFSLCTQPPYHPPTHPPTLQNQTSYGLIFVLGLDGAVKESMHDPTGRTAFASTAHRSSKSGYTFIGSSQNPYLGRVRL